MRKILSILFLICLACDDNSINPSAGTTLDRIEVDGKINSSYEYSNGQLVRENFFGFCVDNPTDELFYSYQNGQVSKLTTTTRSFYANTASQCDPDLGLQSEDTYEYDNQNRLAKVIGEASFREYFYNVNNQVERQVIQMNDTDVTLTAYFNYDVAGNLIEETDFNGNKIYYEYDNNVNPFFLMKQKPAWISPFNKSPNNMIKATGHINYEREFTYGLNGLPVSVSEGGQVLHYKYK